MKGTKGGRKGAVAKLKGGKEKRGNGIGNVREWGERGRGRGGGDAAKGKSGGGGSRGE